MLKWCAQLPTAAVDTPSTNDETEVVQAGQPSRQWHEAVCKRGGGAVGRPMLQTAGCGSAAKAAPLGTCCGLSPMSRPKRRYSARVAAFSMLPAAPPGLLPLLLPLFLLSLPLLPLLLLPLPLLAPPLFKAPCRPGMSARPGRRALPLPYSCSTWVQQHEASASCEAGARADDWLAAAAAARGGSKQRCQTALAKPPLTHRFAPLLCQDHNGAASLPPGQPS